MNQSTRILVVDDHPLIRAGITALVEAEPDLQVCGQAADVPDALSLMRESRPDLILVDLSLKNSSGFDLLREAEQLGIRTIVVSMQESPIWAERALAAGARGFVQKSEAGRVVVQAIRRVLAGRLYVSESISDALLERRVHGASRSSSKAHRISDLTDRELDVLLRIGRGMTTQEISAELNVSGKTVQTYRERIKRKLMLNTAAELSSEATRWVLEHGQHNG